MPMYPYTMDYNPYQWKRAMQYPVRTAYATNGLMVDQGQLDMAPSPLRPVYRNPVTGDEAESMEEFMPDSSVPRMFGTQPFYSRLV